MSLLDTTIGSCSDGSMGLSHGMQLDSLTPKKKNRWLFKVPGFVADMSVQALPPRKFSRPGIQMKEFEFQHLHESIWYPLKGSWKTANLTLFDIRCNQNTIFDWLERIYNPSQGDNLKFSKALESTTGEFDTYKVPTCTLELYDGCGNVIETWTYQNVYPSEITWGELDMESADLVLCDLVLRYDRAFFCRKPPCQ